MEIYALKCQVEEIFRMNARIPGWFLKSPLFDFVNFYSKLELFEKQCWTLLPALVQSVIRRSWFLCSKWKNPSRAYGWGEVGQLY
jgi:hypothetical protein